MRLFHRVVLPALLIGGSVAAQVADQVAARIVQEGLERSAVMRFQDELCHRIGPRLTGSDQFTLACQWASEHFKQMGLETRLEKWGEWKIVWNRGPWYGRVLAPVAFELFVATPAWTAPTQGRVQGALVRMPKTNAEVEAVRPRLGTVWIWKKGRVASDIREAWDAAVAATPPLGFVQSARSTGMADASYENQIRVFGDDNVARGSWERLPKIPQIVVRDDQSGQIEKLLDEGQEVTLEFDIRNQFRPGPIELHNVIADLRGSEKPDECVIVCGHLDSWHQATGATDNGTGVTSTLEAARILTAAGVKPRRTIRFCLWGGEEQGLLGSWEYTKMHRSELDRISAVLNHDTGTNWAQSLTVTTAMFADFERVLAPVLKLTPPQDADVPVFHLRQTETMGVGMGGSDHASFQRAGVPAWSWGLKGRSQYGYGWHSQWDTYDIVIPEYQRHSSTVIALTAAGLADLPNLLSREGITREADNSGEHTIDAYIGRLYGLKVTDKLEVVEALANGAAAKAGLQQGDKVISVWATPVASAGELMGAWRENRGESMIVFGVERGGVKLALETKREPRRPPVVTEPAGKLPGTESGGGKPAGDKFEPGASGR